MYFYVSFGFSGVATVSQWRREKSHGGRSGEEEPQSATLYTYVLFMYICLPVCRSLPVCLTPGLPAKIPKCATRMCGNCYQARALRTDDDEAHKFSGNHSSSSSRGVLGLTSGET